MRSRMFFAFFVILIATAVPVLPQGNETKEVNVSGTWEMTVTTPQRDWTSDVTFTQEKGILKVSMEGPQGTPMTGEGTIKESAVAWTLTISGPQGDFKLFYKGKVEGETMSGEIQMGDFGSSNWTAKKKK